MGILGHNYWDDIDTDWSFRNQVMDLIGTWQFSKFASKLEFHGAPKHDFFLFGDFTACPKDLKLDYFLAFVRDLTGNLIQADEKDDELSINQVADRLREHVGANRLPEWFHLLPFHMKPRFARLQALNKLRITLNLLPDEAFMLGISLSPWAVIRAQEVALRRSKLHDPNASEQLHWRNVLVSRLHQKLLLPSPLDPPRDEILQKLESLDTIVSGMHSWQDVLDFGLQLDDRVFAADPSGIQREINEALAG